MRRYGLIILIMAVLAAVTCGCGPENSDLSDAESAKEASAEDEVEIVELTQEIPILRDSYEQAMGGYVGCAVSGTTIADPRIFEIVTTHFNAVTLENELKPDAVFNYSNSVCTRKEEAEVGGVMIEVPTLNFDRAEKILDKIYDWNAENPDRQIKVRGHVLLWHSQTPEWFFHEGYDKNNPYVPADVMDLRMEWYIKSVLEHFTGPESKYKDMFYGWDVLNEAVSDATGKYRTDKENSSEPLSQDTHSSNSSWWAVYQSEDYIVKAFTYANKYAPADLELYYNDYNECSPIKRSGILALLELVKAHEGPAGEGTRISGMGMQGHYHMASPADTDIEYSIKKYAEVVGKVQITELDLRASEGYTPASEEAKLEEYEKQSKRYEMIYHGIQSAANTDENVQFDGITFWGVADHYSWLNGSSAIGGGNTFGLPCCPLLFDENYEPKPCFYVFAEGSDSNPAA